MLLGSFKIPKVYCSKRKKNDNRWTWVETHSSHLGAIWHVVVMTLGTGECSWRLKGRDQGCYRMSWRAQDRPHNKD